MKSKLRLIGGKLLKSPKGLLTRPTTSLIREALINILREDLKGCHWLDLCSGSGVMACEVLQMGARRVIAIESNKETAKTCKANLISTISGLNHQIFLKVISSEVIQVLKKGCENQSKDFNKQYPSHDYRFDFIYIDPPYKSDLYTVILENILFGKWIKKNGLAICEYSTDQIPPIPKEWIIINQRQYGKTSLIFLTPNLA